MIWSQDDKQVMDRLVEEYGIAGIIEELAERCDIAFLTTKNPVYEKFSTTLWKLLGARDADKDG